MPCQSHFQNLYLALNFVQGNSNSIYSWISPLSLKITFACGLESKLIFVPGKLLFRLSKITPIITRSPIPHSSIIRIFLKLEAGFLLKERLNNQDGKSNIFKIKSMASVNIKIPFSLLALSISLP